MHSAGYALMLVLVLTTVLLVALAATMSRSYGNARLNSRNNQYQNGLYAAEAATERVIARMKSDFNNGNLTAVTNNMDTYRASVPSSTESGGYFGNFQFSDAKGHVGQTYVECTGAIGWGPLASQFGLNGWTNSYRVLSNAKQVNGFYDLTSAVQQDVEMDLIPVFQYAIFYNGLMEFTWNATLTVNGRTHANSNIFVGSSANLTFTKVVTCTGGIFKTNWAGHTTSEFTGSVTYSATPGYITNTHNLNMPIGTNNTSAAVREILNIPPSTAIEPLTSPMAQQRYYNKAGIVMLVSNTTVTAMIKASIADPPTNILATFDTTNYAGIRTNFPFLSITNATNGVLTFTDAREGKLVNACQLDIAQFGIWLRSNNVVNGKFPNLGSVYDLNIAVPNILYMADFRTVPSGQMLGIRLVNGTIIPTNMTTAGLAAGLTISTPNPIYVWGNYNCPNAAHLGTTNTTQTFPASLVCDAVTLLSPSWVDANSAVPMASSGVRVASATTVNAALLAGIVYTTGTTTTTYSGGVMNLPRLLENWGSTTLTLNTSIVNMYSSVQASTQFQMPGAYYYAPNVRNFNFDQNFLDYRKLPPGTPTLPVINRNKWAAPPAGVTNYAGNN
jgi:hypothetical protein